MFQLDNLGSFHVLINSTSPLGAQRIFQKTSLNNRKLDQESPVMLGRMCVHATAILGSRSTGKYNFKNPHAHSSGALTELWKEENFLSSWLFANSG